MEKKTIIKWTILLTLALAVIVPVIVFNVRSPVLIVTESSFLTLYGERRINRTVFLSSLSLYRPVKIVEIANNAGADIVHYAVAEISQNPYCVIFPRRFSQSARIYQEYYPQTKIIILEGKYPRDTVNEEGFYSYYSDIESDFFRAGYAAAAFTESKSVNIAVFFEPNQYLIYGSMAEEAFLKGLDDLGSMAETYFFTSFSDLPEYLEISCLIIAGAGWEFFENGSAGVPVILFSWLDPYMVPSDIVLVIDDSPFAQLLDAVKLSAAGFWGGSVKSRFSVINTGIIGSGILRDINNM
ncbi:MAG: hypothetical protein FWC21_05360 [Treponema sp.]|nr:hypothetical protein [Treponema sp.]